MKLGTRVKVVDGSGIASGQRGVIIHRSQIPTKPNGTPDLPGYYKPVDWSQETAIQYDGGELGTMYKNRLRRIEE